MVGKCRTSITFVFPVLRYYLSKARYSPLTSGLKKLPPSGVAFGSSAPRWPQRPHRVPAEPMGTALEPQVQQLAHFATPSARAVRREEGEYIPSFTEKTGGSKFTHAP